MCRPSASMFGQIDAAERLVIAVATGSLDDVKEISEALRALADGAM